MKPRHRYSCYLYIRCSNRQDPDFGIIKLYKPSGGLLSVIPERVAFWQDEDMKATVLGKLHKLDDIEVSDAEYAKLSALARRMLNTSLPDYAGVLTADLLSDFEWEAWPKKLGLPPWMSK